MILLKKSKQRISSLFVAVAILFSAASLPVFAANEFAYTLTAESTDILYTDMYADAENSDYSHEEYIETLNAAESDTAFLVIFDDAGFPDTNSAANRNNVEVLNVKNGNKVLDITKDMNAVNLPADTAYTWKYWYIRPSGGECLANRGVANIPFKYNFSKIKGGGRNEYVTSLGMDIRSGAVQEPGETVVVVATYANLLDDTKKTKTVTAKLNTVNNVVRPHFYGFKAPENYYIQSITVTSENAYNWPVINDMCFITSEIEGPEPIVDDIKLIGETSLVTPTYHTTDTYAYSYKVLDQFKEEMPDEKVEIIMTEPIDNPSVIFEDGILTIKQSSEVPDVIKLTATSVSAPTISKEFIITLTGSPYYNEELIGVHDGNPEYVLSQFKADLAAAAASEDKDMAIFNFISEEFRHSGSEMHMPLDRTKQDFAVKREGANLNPTTVVDGFYGGNKVTPSAGDKMIVLVPVASGENTYSFVTENLGDLRVTKIGFVMLTYNPMATKDGFAITATFSDGTTKIYSKDIPGGGTASGNTFFGIEAPAGHYITLLDIETVPKVWSAVSEFGFILEKPDTLTVEEAYANMMFSSVTNQDMKNIRENLNLYTTTPEGATIVWESDKESVINPLTGAVTLPDIAENSNVKLTANIKYGVLTKPRRFNVYVPNKLELDANALSIPETVSENIVLPTVGSVQNSTIVWSSDDESLITNEGVVTRPDGRDGFVILKATISNTSGSIEKTFSVSVAGKVRDKVLGGGGGGGGGNTAPSKTPVQVPPVAMQKENTSSFSDVGTTHWAYSSIMKLLGKGVVNGIGENKFEPEGNVTREQFVSMLVRAMEFKSDNSDSAFTDVAKDSWCQEAISVAADMGIVSGRGDGSFGIGENITREDMAVMAYRALRAAGKELKENSGVIWADDDAISDYAKDAISLLKGSGIINGMTENEFSPKSTSTRAQAATIICRMLEGV